MSLLLLAPKRDMQPWKEALLRADSNLDIKIWPEVERKENVHFIVAWGQPDHVLDSYPNLKAITSLGAGVDHILRDQALPNDVPICRVVSSSLIRQMKEYVLSAILNYQRNFFRYASQRHDKKWKQHPNKSPDAFNIGIMGLGELGKPTARLLSELGYQVRGWSRTGKKIPGVETFAGASDFSAFLNGTTLLVCMLPLTGETSGILDLDTFKALKHPAYLINVARGEHLVEEDLIYALDKGWLEGALLDVFSEEPLPSDHPFWNRKNIMITPHVCSLTPPDEVAEQIVENYKRALSGMELENKVDRGKGY